MRAPPFQFSLATATWAMLGIGGLMFLHHFFYPCGLMADGIVASVVVMWVAFELMESQNDHVSVLSVPLLFVGFGGLLFSAFGFLLMLTLRLTA